MRYSPIIMLIILLASTGLYSQTSTITYQGKLLNSTGDPITNSSLPMTFAIYNAQSGGSKLWPTAVASKNVNVDLGLYTVVLGTGSGSDEAFTTSVFAGGQAWLEINVDGTTLARTRLTTVPFSYHSSSLGGNTWAEPGAIGATTPSTGKFTNLTVGTYSFPASDGSNGQVLTTDGSGNVSWQSPGSAPVTSVAESGTTPLTVTPTTGNVEITISQANGTTDGYLSSTDWNTFNNKSTLALGETNATAYRGDRGKAAYDERGSQIDGTGLNWDGSELNVTWGTPDNIGTTTAAEGAFTKLSTSSYTFPQFDGTANYVLQTNGSGVVSWTAIPSAPVTSVAESGTTPLTVSPTTGNVQITIGEASGSADGYLSSGDWTTFNNKTTLALGETNATAYRGDRGKTAYDERGSQIDGTGLNWDGSELDVTWATPGDVGGTTPAGASFTGINIGDYQMPGSDGANGQVLTTNGSGTVSWQTFSGAGWSLTGNLGTTPGTHFIGTGDNNALEVKVNDDRVARFEPDATSPNILMGSSSNSFSDAIHGAAILGGGSAEYWQEAGDDFTTICGGEYNWAYGDYSFIGGGGSNETDGWFATIGGGEMNYSSNTWSFVGGGVYNEADAIGAVVVGGEGNGAYGENSFIGGGASILNAGDGAFVGGGGPHMLGSTVAVIVGGSFNLIDDESIGSFIGGGGFHTIEESEASVICGGIENSMSSASFSVVCGGESNTISQDYSVIPGGKDNSIDGNYCFAFGNDVDVANNYHTAFYTGTNSGTFTINRESANNGIFQIGTDGSNGNGAYLSAGGTWTNGSSIKFKDRFKELDVFGILDKIKTLRLKGWFYKGTNEFHIWPFSEDFHDTFGTGDLSNPRSRSYLSGADVAGIGLAGVKALSQKVETLESENQELKSRLQLLEEKLQKLIDEKR